MKPRLAILIPSIFGEPYLDRLLSILEPQVDSFNGEAIILINTDSKEKTTGVKRNELVALAVNRKAEYVAHFDSDDIPSHDYVAQQLSVAHSGKDCGSLWGSIYFSGVVGKPFHHSIEYDHWFENSELYARCPNHLNCIKTDLVKQIPFPDKTIGEDGVQSELLAKSGLLKTQHQLSSVIYHYFTGNKGTELENKIIKSLSL